MDHSRKYETEETMKNKNQKMIAIALAIGGAATMAGCGASSPPPAIAGAIPGATTAAGVGTCVPVNNIINYTLTGAYFDAQNIVGGPLGNYSSAPVGTSMVSSGGVTGQLTPPPAVQSVGGLAGPYTRTNAEGDTITMSLTPGTTTVATTPYAGYPNNTYPVPSGYGYGVSAGTAQSSVNATGQLLIGAYDQGQILLQMSTVLGYGGYNNGYNPFSTTGVPGTTTTSPYGTTGICVSGIGINAGHYQSTLYGGWVYLYMNNTSHGYALQF
jgi:hypothetical protein